MNTPNKLTVFRAAMVPVFLAVLLIEAIPARFLLSALIFGALALTDMIDGKMARKYGLITNFGKFLDPLADKLLVISSMVIFCQWGKMPSWALMIVLAREFAVTGLRLVAVGKGKVIAAGWSGKVKTASTMIGLCVMMVFPNEPLVATIVNAVIVITTVYSGFEYFIQNWNCLWND